MVREALSRTLVKQFIHRIVVHEGNKSPQEDHRITATSGSHTHVDASNSVSIVTKYDIYDPYPGRTEMTFLYVPIEKSW